MTEYIVWQVFDRRLDWFTLEQGEYVNLLPDSEGIIHSQVFPGLWLAVGALLKGEMQSVLAELQTGLQSTEHQAFVPRLVFSAIAKPIIRNHEI